MNMLGTVLGCLRDGVYSAVCYGKRSQRSEQDGIVGAQILIVYENYQSMIMSNLAPSAPSDLKVYFNR